MTNTHEREDLPELPVCVVEAEVTWRGSLFATLKREDQKGFVRHLYTADQMREYGRLCRAGREDELEALERNLVDAMNTIHRCDKSRERWLTRAVRIRRAYVEARDLLKEVRYFMDNEDIDWTPIGKPPLLQRINGYLRRLSPQAGGES
jgi:hypothetical protein